MSTVVVKERPILFSGPMVRALLAGTKTQTRRAIKCPAKHLEDIWQSGHFDIQPRYNKPGYEMWDWEYDSCRTTPLVCPYGQPGDRLWVRESCAFLGERLRKPEGVPGYLYRADSNEFDGAGIKWKPSIHMPRAASRLLLEITAVRVERVQDISESDAVAEGVEVPANSILKHAAVLRYKALWASINGPESWAANPWVWVVEFKVIEGGKEVASA